MSTDVMMAAAGTAAALAVAAWPKLRTIASGVKWPSMPAPKAAGVSFQAAISALSVVRSRIVATGASNSEGVTKAVEVLTLALVEGSDK